MSLVRIQTSLGNVTLSLEDRKSPNTVKNFLTYVKEGFYNGTIIHRVIPGFMIQGGGFLSGMMEKDGHPSIDHEGANGLSNLRGTIAMARTNDPHSASSQFFINTVDNKFLDFTRPSGQGWGYAVFGKVTEGIETIDAIARVKTRSRAGHDDVPTEDVTIESVTLVEE